MNAPALTGRAIRADDLNAVTIEPRNGFVSICTNRLPQPLGLTKALQAVALLVRGILKVWPGSARGLRAVFEAAIAQGSAPDQEPRL